jgi:transcriptional regulator with XRE-family HTH domain
MIGAILRQLRKERSFSLRKLSQMTGISHSFICDVEHGRSNPSIDNLQILASALGVPARIFLKEPVAAADHSE